MIDQLEENIATVLQTKRPISLVLDNNILNEFLRSSGDLSRFAQFVNSENLEINIPSDVIIEFATGKIVIPECKRAGVLFRMTQLREFVEKIDDISKIKFNLSFPAQINREIERPKRVARALLSKANIKSTVLLGARDIGSAFDEIQVMAARRKTASIILEKEDKFARRSELFASEYVIEWIRDFRPRLAKKTLRSLLVQQSRRFNLDLSANLISKVIASSNRYPVLNAFYDLLTLHHLTVLLPKTKAPEDLKPLLGIHRNDRSDFLIAATAARQDFFLTSDRGLAAKCEYLRARGSVKFETVLLDGGVKV